MRLKTFIHIPVFISVFLGLSISAFSQENNEVVNEEITGHIYKPAKVSATSQRVNGLSVPEGFSITKFDDGLGSPRMIAVSSDGMVYVTRRDAGNVVMLIDSDKDGKAESRKVVAEIPSVHGITIHDDKMYLATVKKVYAADIKQDGTLGKTELLIDDLPDGGQHPNRTIDFGPDGRMYISVGSTCNACDETNEESATLLVANTDGSDRRVYAAGLRNMIGFDWHPETEELYGMDHGIDWLGNQEQHEELNHIKSGAIYGWPYIYDKGKINKADAPDSLTYAAYADMSQDPLLLMTAHSAPMNFMFYTGNMFPEEYNNDAFVTMHGSWNRKPAVGYKIVRVTYKNGQPQKYEDFITGFLTNNGTEHFGRVVGLAEYTDGSLLVTDDANGVVYRVSYR